MSPTSYQTAPPRTSMVSYRTSVVNSHSPDVSFARRRSLSELQEIARVLGANSGAQGRHIPGPIQAPYLSAARAFAFAASSSRFFGGAFVSSDWRKRVEMPA